MGGGWVFPSSSDPLGGLMGGGLFRDRSQLTCERTKGPRKDPHYSPGLSALDPNS